MSDIQFVNIAGLKGARENLEPPSAESTRSSFSLTVRGDAIPHALLDQDAISEQVRAGLRQVEITEQVDFDAASAAAQMLRLVRDLTSCSVKVNWALKPHQFSIEPLYCLQPPAEINGAQPEALRDWSARFRFGLLYWRAGPNFIVIRDARTNAINHFTLDEPDYIKAIWAGHFGKPFSEVSAEAVDALTGEGLIYTISDQAVLLPYRMRHWPIPFNGV